MERLTTLSATMPPSSAQSTAIQPRPAVRRTIRLESEMSRTAPAALTAACGISAAPARAGCADALAAARTRG